MLEQSNAIRHFPSINEVITDPAKLIANPPVISAPAFSNEGSSMTSKVCKGTCSADKRAKCPFSVDYNT